MVYHPKKHHLSPRNASGGNRSLSEKDGSVHAGSGISSRIAKCSPAGVAKPPGDGGECLEFFDRVFLNTFEIFANWKFWNWSRDLCGALAFHIF